MLANEMLVERTREDSRNGLKQVQTSLSLYIYIYIGASKTRGPQRRQQYTIIHISAIFQKEPCLDLNTLPVFKVSTCVDRRDQT